MDITLRTARRYILGRQGLWPGRRWAGRRGTERAMRAMEHLQLDPLATVTRAQDLMLASRVIDYRPDDWMIPTYERRRFFEWGGWLAVRPMDELPYWRVLMRRERDLPGHRALAREHADAIAEMRHELTQRRTIANRDFAMTDRTRVDHYRGRKDSAVALHYLWRIGEAMVHHRDRFERVYARADRVAPARWLHEASDADADEFHLRTMVASAGLTRFNGVRYALVRDVSSAELRDWRSARVEDGTLLEVQVEGWRAPHYAMAEDAGLLADAGRRSRPEGMARPGNDDDRGDDVPLAARPGQRPRPGGSAVRLRVQVGGLHAGRAAPVRLLRAPRPVGRSPGRPVRRPNSSEPRGPCTCSASGSRIRAWSTTRPSPRRSSAGWRGSPATSVPSGSTPRGWPIDPCARGGPGSRRSRQRLADRPAAAKPPHGAGRIGGGPRHRPQGAMTMTSKIRLARLALAGALLGALVVGTAATATAGGPKILDAKMAGIPTGGLVINGLTGGGVPWSLEDGKAMLFADGRLHVEVEGLVVAASGVNPIPMGHAVVTCGEAKAATTADRPVLHGGRRRGECPRDPAVAVPGARGLLHQHHRPLVRRHRLLTQPTGSHARVGGRSGGGRSFDAS